MSQTNSVKTPSSETSETTISMARRNSRMASYVAFSSAGLTILSLVVVLIIDVNYGKVAAVPVGNIWDLPVAGRIYVPSRIEENAKPIHVALRYIRNFYEVDLTDFVQLGADTTTTGGPVMISTKATQLLPYVIPGTEEYINALKTIEYSSVNYRLFNESKCWRRFLVDTIEMQDSLSGTKRVDVTGTMIIACDDTTKPIPSQNIGTKMITIYLAKGTPTMFKTREQTDEKKTSKNDEKSAEDSALNGRGISSAEIAALNPEGWFVVKNVITPLTEAEVTVLTEARQKQGTKPVR
jgi:hypothetical protein